jgi:hypothetical protein
VNCKFSNIECLEESCAICSSANRLWFQNISRYGGVPCFPSRNPGTLPYFSVDARNNSPPPRPTRDSSLFPKPLVQVQCGAKEANFLGSWHLQTALESGPLRSHFSLTPPWKWRFPISESPFGKSQTVRRAG